MLYKAIMTLYTNGVEQQSIEQDWSADSDDEVAVRCDNHDRQGSSLAVYTKDGRFIYARLVSEGEGVLCPSSSAQTAAKTSTSVPQFARGVTEIPTSPIMAQPHR